MRLAPKMPIAAFNLDMKRSLDLGAFCFKISSQVFFSSFPSLVSAESQLPQSAVLAISVYSLVLTSVRNPAQMLTALDRSIFTPHRMFLQVN